MAAKQARHALLADRLGYVQVARGSIELNGKQLDAGDGAMLRNEPEIALGKGKQRRSAGVRPAGELNRFSGLRPSPAGMAAQCPAARTPLSIAAETPNARATVRARAP